jgi:hypothetical protein
MEVDQRWQIGFKMGIALKDGTVINLLSLRDAVGEARLGTCVFPAGKVGRKTKRVTFEQLRGGLPACFARRRALPDGIQTDGELFSLESLKASSPVASPCGSSAWESVT